MKVNKVLFLVGKYLGDKELVEQTNGKGGSSEGVAIIGSYIDLLNIVQKRIATEEIVLKTKEVVETDSQKIEFAKLSKKYCKLIKVLKDGKNVYFDILEDGISIQNGKYEIWYQYLPNEIAYIDENIFDFNGRISERVYALGVASEYCLLNGMYDMANYFEEKFINSLNSLKMYFHQKTMPKRRWL